MQNFYSDRVSFTDTTVTLNGNEYRHATRSCRVKVGEVIGVMDGCGKRVEARIVSIGRKTLTAVIEHDRSGRGEPSLAIHLALSLIKPARFELAIEKCTELGARRFIPVITERCAWRPERFNFDRLKKIAFEAAKQSGRSWLPSITEPVNLSDVFAYTHGIVLVALRHAEQHIGSLVKHLSGSDDITLIIGPEGDFTDMECDILMTGNALPVSLSGLTLRSETAAIIATALCCSYTRKIMD